MVDSSTQNQRPNRRLRLTPFWTEGFPYFLSVVTMVGFLAAEPFILRWAVRILDIPQPQQSARQFMWFASMILLVGFLAVVGHAITKRWDGVLVDEKNRISLARLKLICWTVVLLAAIHTAVSVNISIGQEEPVVPIDPKLLALMGLQLGSVAIATYLNNRKLDADPVTFYSQHRTESGEDCLSNFELYRQNLEREESRNPDAMQPQGQSFFNLGPEDARWTNLFEGDDQGNVGHVAISRVQAFFFNLITLMSYGAALFETFGKGTGPIGKLPAISVNTLALLAISETAYQGGKLLVRPTFTVPARRGRPPDATQGH